GTTCEITDKKGKGLPESGKGEALEIPHSPEKEPVSCLTDWHYAIISSLSITDKRQQEIAFSDKLYAADSRLIAAKGSPIQPTLDSLKGKHVGVLQGSTQEAYANETWRSKGVDVVAYANQDLVYSDLAAGRLDAALQDEVAASEGFLKQPAGKDFAFAGSSVKDKKYFGDGTGVGLRKDDAELTAAFNKALGELRQDGTYDKMAKKYFDFNVYGD
ncbi:transporter substrate-binding domain-containing protein, partial [Escherichia coli]